MGDHRRGTGGAGAKPVRDFGTQPQGKPAPAAGEDGTAGAGGADVMDVGLTKRAAGGELDAVEEAGAGRGLRAPDRGPALERRAAKLPDSEGTGAQAEHQPRPEVAVEPGGGAESRLHRMDYSGAARRRKHGS